jgi:hypothetical protein
MVAYRAQQVNRVRLLTRALLRCGARYGVDGLSVPS